MTVKDIEAAFFAYDQARARVPARYDAPGYAQAIVEAADARERIIEAVYATPADGAGPAPQSIRDAWAQYQTIVGIAALKPHNEGEGALAYLAEIERAQVIVMRAVAAAVRATPQPQGANE